jgi:hypothetical protein
MALFNELSTQKGSKSLNLAPAATPAARTQVQPVAEPTNAGPFGATPATNVMPTPIARPMQPKTQMPSVPQASQTNTVPTNNSAQPVAQDNFKNYYTEQSDTANLYQQQNANPNAQQESNEQRLYMNALNDIENALKQNDRNTAEAIYNKTFNEFKNPKRKDLFGKQIQRVRSKYLSPVYIQGPKQ